MGVSASVTTTQTTAVKLKPALVAKLRRFLTIYQKNDAAIKDLLVAQAAIKAEIEAEFIKAGEFGALQEGVRIDDIPLKHISGTSKSVDWKYIHAQGWMTTTQKAEATKERPKKPYLKITLTSDDTSEEGGE